MPVSTILLRIRIYDALRVNLAPDDCDALRVAVAEALNLAPGSTRDALLRAARCIVAASGVSLAWAARPESGEIIDVQLARGSARVSIA